MILVFGGTTEGRRAAAVLEQAGKPFLYSTLSGLQYLGLVNGKELHGALDAKNIADLCDREGIRLIVDAAHPFASRLHAEIARASENTGLPVVRFERIYTPVPESAVRCADYDDAVRKMRKNGVKRLLALTGVQTITRLEDFWKDNFTIFRILDREDSYRKVVDAGFPSEQTTIYNGGEEDLERLIDEYRPDAIITKESGVSGGFGEKIEAARKKKVAVYVVIRPELPAGFHIVTGELTLRRAVEEFVPGFFELRSGITTGLCACAAAKTALLELLGRHSEYVDVTLPSGEVISLQCVESGVRNGCGFATMIKDGGDDPDVTHGASVVAEVRFSSGEGIRFIGGEGVGTVTLPGLGLEVGSPAINNVPRKMMEHELCGLYNGGLEVTISVPGGEKLAEKTFNGRVGVLGGISIIGTSGIVMPFSHEAFVEAMHREFKVAKASGAERVVINSGARSEKAVKGRYPLLPPQAFIHYGNAVGEALEAAVKENIGCLTIGLMIGKAVKLAEGNLDTHSHKVTMNREFLCTLAREAGCPPETVESIGRINLARELWGIGNSEGMDLFFSVLVERCALTCGKVLRNCECEVLLIDDSLRIMHVLQKRFD